MTEGTRQATAKPAVIAISSHVARGSVGNRSAVFALETLGHPVWSVPTIILPYHLGHGKTERIVPVAKQFATLLENLINSPWIDEVQAVISGFMAETSQVDAVADLVKRLKQRDPNLTYLCDPVIGDTGGLYVAEDIAAAIRDQLMPLADISTPNVHEFAWLAAENEVEDISRIARLAAGLGPKRSIITSTPALMRGNIGNLSVDPEMAIMVEHKQVDGPTNGSGDLFSALYLAHFLAGLSREKALEKTAASVFEINARAAARGDDELMPETDSASIVRPMAPVHMRQLAGPVRETG